MATTYKTEKTTSGNFDIFRNDEFIATYDPIEEKLTWVKEEFKRFQNHVTREVNALLEAPAEASAPDAPAETPEAPAEAPVQVVPEIPNAGENSKDFEIRRLKNMIMSQQIEITRLNDEVKKLRGGASNGSSLINPRFTDKIDLTGSPVQDPNLGDLTPAFVEWARENMPYEIFVKRYKNRIADISKPQK